MHYRMMIVMVMVVWLAGCCTAPTRPGVINHPVFFTLHDPADAGALITDCDAMLAAIPQVTAYYCGRPFDSGRDTVDHNYDVGLYLGFDSADDYAAYVEHPLHVELVQRWGPRLKSLRVHDVLDETP